MPDDRLYAMHPLGGRAPLRESLDGVEMEEAAGRSLVSIAARLGAETALRRKLREAFGIDLPGPGRLAVGHQIAFAWMGRGQWMADAAEDAVPALEAELAAAAGGTASLTDQSDAWVRLRLSGRNVRAALGRLCMLDLDDERFPHGSAARTVVEHLGAVILHPEPGIYELWSARSSARSFADAIRAASSFPGGRTTSPPGP